MAARKQTDVAQLMYDGRAATYEDSWHPSYTARFMALVDVRPGQRVLDLCCGTGLDLFRAAEAVGPAGTVVGVDASAGMLEKAREKKTASGEVGDRVTLLIGDVAALHTVNGLEEAAGGGKERFDWIICSNAFVLLEDPPKVVAHWREYLAAGGRVAIDITHERNLRSGLVLERAMDRIGEEFAFHRAWIRSADSFGDVLTAAGFEVESCTRLDKISGKGSVYYGVDEADAQFDYIINASLSQVITDEGVKARARVAFREEWENAAVDGKVEAVDALYVYIARKK